MALGSAGMMYWLKELQWAREQITKAKTPREKELTIQYHKDICAMGKK